MAKAAALVTCQAVGMTGAALQNEVQQGNGRESVCHTCQGAERTGTVRENTVHPPNNLGRQDHDTTWWSTKIGQGCFLNFSCFGKFLKCVSSLTKRLVVGQYDSFACLKRSSAM